MKSLLLYITLMLLCTPLCHGGQNSAPLEECNTLYHDTQYEEAIHCYQKIQPEGYSAALLYNIGNSYAQLGQTGNSVLYYQRALCLSPGDSDIKGNLRLVRDDEGLFSPEPAIIEKLAGLLSISQWSLLTLTTLTVYLIFSIFQIKRRQSRTIELLVILCCIVVGVVSVIGASLQHRNWNRSVVISDSKLLLSPFSSATPSGAIKQGRLIFPHKQHNEFRFVTDETGRKGWILLQDIAPVIPLD